MGSDALPLDTSRAFLQWVTRLVFLYLGSVKRVQQKEGSPHEVVWTFDASLPFVVCICEEAIGGAPEIVFSIELLYERLCEVLVT